MSLPNISNAPAGSACLTTEHRRIVHDVFSRLLPQAEVWIFGSHATGRARPFSDLDLLVCAREPLRWEQRIALQDALEASELSFQVDVVEGSAVEGAVLSRIEREGSPL